MAHVILRRPKGVGGLPEMDINMRQALLGNDGRVWIQNRFVTESDPARQIDYILTDGAEVLVGAEGTVLWG